MRGAPRFAFLCVLLQYLITLRGLFKLLNKSLRFVFVVLAVFLVVGCGGKPVAPVEVLENAPENFVYDPAEHGEAVPVEIDSVLSVDFCGVDLERGDYLAGVDTLEYRSAVYGPGGELQYVVHVRLRGLKLGCPDMRYDDYEDGYALIATEKGVWVREAGSREFEPCEEFDDYDAWLYEESIYLQAISLWDGKSLLFTPSSPATGSLVLVYDINPGVKLDKSLFEPKGE